MYKKIGCQHDVWFLKKKKYGVFKMLSGMSFLKTKIQVDSVTHACGDKWTPFAI